MKIHRLYINNFRCLSNFTLNLDGASSLLLLGRNGTGKSSIAHILELLRKLALGQNRISELVKPTDRRGGIEEPLRIEIQTESDGIRYEFRLALELPPAFREFRVLEESLFVDGAPYYTRDRADVALTPEGGRTAQFRLDWHLVALPIVQEKSTADPLYIFRRWMGQMLIFAPLPPLMKGESKGETLSPNRHLTNIGEWFTGLIAHWPAAYGHIERYAKEVMTDFSDIQNPLIGDDARSLTVNFDSNETSLRLPFQDLSDGEKCLFAGAMTIAFNRMVGRAFCFWDEPDNYLSISEVGHFVRALRSSFQKSEGQIIIASHNAETIRQFSSSNTEILFRRNHIEPTILKKLSEIQVSGDLVSALTRNDVEP